MLLAQLYKSECLLQVLPKEKLFFIFNVLDLIFALPKLKIPTCAHCEDIVFLILDRKSAKVIDGLIMSIAIASLVRPIFGMPGISIEAPHNERFVR
jgi:hypothetical protein